MLIPMADVPRWYAERKPKDTVAISHGADTLTWEQLERGANRRARAFAAKGVKPGDFVAIGLPNGNAFFETTFAVWKFGATPTSLSWRLPRGEAAAVLEILKPALVVGGEADWNAPNSVPADFAPEGVSDEPINSPVARYWKAMTSGGSTGRPKVILDHGPAVVETAGRPDARNSARCFAAQSRPALPQRALHSVPHGTVRRRSPHRHGEIRCRGGTAPDRRPSGAMGQFRADHDAPDLGAAGRGAQQLRSFEPSNRVSHGRADAAMAEGEMDRVAGAGEDLRALWRHRAAGRLRDFRRRVAGAQGFGRQDRRNLALRIIGEDGNDVAPGETGEIYFLPNDGVGSTYHYLGAEPKRRPDGWELLGDIGRLDAEGYLYLGDRLADMILRGGANIYPAEIEAAVMAHPQVSSCVAVGLPDPEFGQRVHAILELKGDADAQSVIDGMGGFLADRLSRYKHPESFEIVDSARATMPARSAARCCATSARRG